MVAPPRGGGHGFWYVPKLTDDSSSTRERADGRLATGAVVGGIGGVLLSISMERKARRDGRSADAPLKTSGPACPPGE